MTGFTKWTSIDKFSDTVVAANRSYTTSMWFSNRIKLHGTNAAVRVDAGQIPKFQKRSQDVTVDNDNFGFAQWASGIDWIEKDHDYIIYGEWAGNGINNNDAITTIATKEFFVFAVKVADDMITSDTSIMQYLPKNDKIHVIPSVDPIEIVFNGGGNNTQQLADKINSDLDKIAVRDEYVYEKFGVDGPGEGYVYFPVEIGKDRISVSVYNSFVFKVKTDAHSVNKTKGIKARVEIPASIYDFADTFATDNRIAQMYMENCGNEYSMKNTETVIKAVFADIEKESVNERESGNIAMKDAQKIISGKVVKWLKDRCNGI